MISTDLSFLDVVIHWYSPDSVCKTVTRYIFYLKGVSMMSMLQCCLFSHPKIENQCQELSETPARS